MKSFLLLLFISIPCLLGAQSWYDKSQKGQKKESFVITMEGDTISGLLEFDAPYKMAKRISFLHKDSEEIQKYRASDIKGFGIYGKAWVSKEIRIPYLDVLGGTTRKVHLFLLPLIEKGPIQLYLHYINETFISEHGEYIPAYSYVLFKDETYVYMRGDDDWLYNNKIWALLNDSEDIITGIQSEEYVWDDLITLVKRYNYFKSKEKKE